MKKNNKPTKENFNSVLAILKELNKLYPNQGIGRHIHDATLEHNNLWGISDKELLFALTKYKTELELNVVSDEEIKEIYDDAMNLEDDFAEGFNLTDDTEFDVE